MSERQRIDVWLFRARLVKTRAVASRLVAEGGVRIVHDGVPRRLEKPSVEVAPGDALLFSHGGRLIAIKVKALGARRGPSAEARALYSELDAESLA
ncbi:S4 domain-containing protein [Candidatus Viadribacter manganicus]|uniref:RNA-binding protein n=1 Tax=Candidatus Viadribacter manganicus TaxID=1759059 RepID=A0A1B1AIQ4_9PROT|nr:S4 domain-containing protein [Candidatus Viadribacter manganicus]ANP46446.1 RNA-binding protein [Candidatus Viadribacter manganicus]